MIFWKAPGKYGESEKKNASTGQTGFPRIDSKRQRVLCKLRSVLYPIKSLWQEGHVHLISTNDGHGFGVCREYLVVHNAVTVVDDPVLDKGDVNNTKIA